MANQALIDLATLADALSRNERWRYDVVLPRVLTELGEVGEAAHVVLGDEPLKLIEYLRYVLEEEVAQRDVPKTRPPEGSCW